MKTINHETKNPFAIFPLQGRRLCGRGTGVVRCAPFLTGMALAVVLGSMVALSTPAFAMGGGGGGGGSAPAPKVTKVDDPVTKPKDEAAEVKQPVVDPGDKTPAVSELKAKKPKEETLVTEDPDEDKAETRPNEKTTESPKPETVEAVVGFAESSSRVAENGGLLQIRVRISEPLPQPVTLHVATGGTATRGADYAILSTVTIPANATSASLTLTGIDDDADEADESVTLTLGGILPAGARFDNRAHTVTIIDDDAADEMEVVKKPEEETPEVAVRPGDGAGDEADTDAEDKTETRPNEKTTESPKPETVEAVVGFAESSSRVAENGGPLQIQVRISEPLPQSVTLHVATGGTATRGEDYEISSTVTIPANATSASLTLTGVDDDADEADETVTLTLGGALPAGARFDKYAHIVTIIDNDVAGGIEVVKKPEEETPEVAVRPGDDAGDDGTADTGGEADTDAEDKTETKPDEVTVELPEPEVVEAAVVGFATATSFSDVKEGDTVELPVVLSSPLPQTITLSVEVSGSISAGSDITPLPSVVTFPQGTTTAFINFTVVDDTVVESNETLTLSLWRSEELRALPGGPYVKRIYPRAHQLIITDNDLNDESDQVTEVDEKPEEEASEKDETPIVNEGHVHDMRVGRNEDSIIIENLGIVDDDIYARSFGNGGIEIINRGTVGEDIYAKGWGDGGIKVVNHGAVDDDISVQSLGDGGIEVVNRGTVGDQISTRSSGDGGIEIVNYGIVERFIGATPGNGVTSIGNWGTVGHYINVQHGDGETSVENWGVIGEHINVTTDSGGGDINIVNHGTVDEHIYVASRGKISIENGGAVNRNITVVRSSGDVRIANHGTVNKNISIRNSEGGGIKVLNHGVVNGDIRYRGYSEVEIVNRGSVNGEISGGNGIIRFDGNVGRSADLESKTVRLGSVNFDSGRMHIEGDYEGLSETQLNFHVGPGRWYGLSYGSLLIDGDVTGQSRVSLIVDDVSLITESINFPGMVSVYEGHDVRADSFVGEQTIGAFDFVLEYNHEYEWAHEWTHEWGFVNQGLSDAAKKTSKIADELSDKIETPPANNPDKKPELGLWGEQNGSHTTIGLNALTTSLMGGDMVVGTSVSRNFSTSNNIDVESQVTALAASWERNGFYAGGQTRYARFTSDVSTDRLSVVRDNDGTGVNASVDLGYRFALPFDGVDFQVAPQMQLVWSRVNFDDFVGPHGERVSLEDGDLTTGRLGLSWDGEWQGAGGFGRIYGGMNLRSAVDGKTSVNISGVSIANERKGLSVDGKLGLSYEWDEGYAVHGEVSALRDDDADEVRADLGVRISF